MKNKIIGIIFIIIIFAFPISLLVTKDTPISYFERRHLTTKEELKENFSGKLENYLEDQVPIRNILIGLNDIYNRYILGNIESNGVYVDNNYIYEKNYPLNLKSVNKFIDKINYINDNHISNSNVYFSIIPDKSYFLDSNKYLKIDYDSLINNLKDNINIEYIDIINLLKLEDYYKTDIHIKQKSYSKIIESLSKYLNFDRQIINYKENVYDKFYGASYSKNPINKPDKLIYLSNNEINNAKVWHLEYGEKNVYDIEKLGNIDSYDVYLSGASALITIENENVESDKELIIFRDSFSSSLAPLLIPYYDKITLVDLRYISLSNALNYITLDNKDILFLYSTLIVNNSSILKTN